MTLKAEQAARSRDALVGAAARLFAERGYRGASVQAIGEEAGVSRGSIFWHFGSKEGLLFAVVENAFEDWRREVLLPDVGAARGAGAVRAGIRAHRRFLETRGQEIRLLFVLLFEALGPQPALAPEFASLHRGLREMAAGLIGDSAERGEMRDDVDPKAIAAIVVGALGGLAYQWLLDPAALDLDRAYRDLDSLVERGLAPATI